MQYELAVSYIDHRGYIKTRTMGFDSEDARARWIERNEADIVEVLGFRDPA